MKKFYEIFCVKNVTFLPLKGLYRYRNIFDDVR